jgi:hypothetical protein
MRLTIPFLILNLVCLPLLAQEEVLVTGNLTDHEGYPLVGANVVIKGTARGVVADLNGNYEIYAPVGATLVVSYVGYLPQEFVVSANGKAVSSKRKQAEPPAANKPASQNQKIVHPLSSRPVSFGSDTSAWRQNDPENGVAVMSNHNTYKIRWGTNSSGISHLRYISTQQRNQSQITVFEEDKAKKYYKPVVHFNSSYETQRITRLPAIQQKFSQGRPVDGELRWQGPETGEQFAWGPAVSALEYDGSSYPYDAGGRLVAAGTGNGIPARSFDAGQFFTNGISAHHSLRVNHQVKKFKYYAGYKNNYQRGIIPLSKFRRNTLEAGGSYHSDRFTFEGDITGSNVLGLFSGNEPFGYQLMRSVLLTPPSFDNTNGNGTHAMGQENSWMLESGLQRSSAFEANENPYWILNNWTDKLNNQRTTSKAVIEYILTKDLRLSATVGYDHQSKETNTGTDQGSFAFPGGIQSKRKQQLEDWSMLSDLQYNLNARNHTFKFTAGYSCQDTRAKIHRVHHSGNHPEGLANYQYYLHNGNRLLEILHIRVNYNFRDIALLTPQVQRSRYSDTPEKKAYTGASMAGGIKLGNIRMISNSLYFLNHCKITGSIGQSYKAASLIIDPDPYGSIHLHANQLHNYFSADEITYAAALKPEKIRDMNLGFDLGIIHNQLTIEGSWYRRRSDDAVMPVYRNGEPVPENIASLTTQGMDLSFQYQVSGWRRRFRTSLTFTKFNTVVTDLYSEETSIPLSGFEFVSSNAMAGQPLGVITGTRYLRNEEGQYIIGDDGFPLADKITGIIGNPNPDWISALNTYFSYQGFELGFQLELKKGGDVWNGTQSTLNYYGLSEETAALRETKGYIFQGVLRDGSVNNIPVDFAGTDAGLRNNRWTRYGIAGVAEEGMADASWLRLRRASITYALPSRLAETIYCNRISMSLFATNLFCVTRYSGVDPEGALFGNAAGNGLDYFNMPSVRTFGLAFNLTF